MLDDSQPLISEMILEVFNGEFCSSGLTSFNILATSALFRGFIILDKPGDSHFFFFFMVDAILTFSWVGDVIFTWLVIVEGFLVFFVLGVCDDLVAASEDCLGFSCLGLLPVVFSAPSGILFLLVFLGGFLPVGSSSNMSMS